MLSAKVFIKTENYWQSSHGNLGPPDPTARTNRTRSSLRDIVENRTSALTSKKLLQAEIETGFCQVITKNEKVFCRKRSASLWFESVTKRWRGGWFSPVLPRKNSKTILENSRFSRRKTGQYITEKKNRNKKTNPSWIKPKTLYLFEVMIDFAISNSVLYQQFQDLFRKVHDRAQSFVFRSYTMHELRHRNVSIG